MLPIIPAGRCLLRPWREDDIAPLVAIANNASVARNLTHLFPNPYTTDDARHWIASNLAPAPRFLAWAIEVDGRLAGGIGIHPGEGVFRRTAEIGYWLGEPYWGRGIATAAVRATVAWTFATLPIARLEAAVFAGNGASVRVLEKCGFDWEAVLKSSAERDGQLVDRVIYARLRPAPT